MLPEKVFADNALNGLSDNREVALNGQSVRIYLAQTDGKNDKGRETEMIIGRTDGRID